MLDAAWALVLHLYSPRRRRRLSQVAAFAPQRLVCRRRRRRATAVAVVNVVFHVFVQLLEEEGTLQTHLLHTSVQTQDALAGRVV